MTRTLVVLVVSTEQPAAKPVIETTGEVLRARPIRNVALRPHRNQIFDAALAKLNRWLARVA